MSLWKNYLTNEKNNKLDKNIEVDTLIIGGGITGLTTLYYLKEQLSTCLVDASTIGRGITLNTTGKLTYLQGAIYSELSSKINQSVAIKYLNSQKYAIDLIKDIIKKENISCDLEKVKSYVFTEKDKEISKLKKENDFLIKQGIKVSDEPLPLGTPSKYAISVADTYVFNPIKYLNHLKIILNNKQIYENTKIVHIKLNNNKYYCYTDDYQIIAKKVIIACHYPFFLKPLFLPLKSHIEKSYLIACKSKENNHFSCITVSNPGMSFRYYQDGNKIYKIYLSSSHNTAIKQNDLKNFDYCIKKFNIQKEDIVAKWSNIDIITDDRLPYIGEIKKNMYIATGFNTWGMTNGILAAKIISDNILNKNNNYESIFKPNRFNISKVESIIPNTASTLKSFIGSKFKNKSWYKENIKFKKINGEDVAIYIDEENKEHIVYNKCPHMKCGLIFNEVEKTWDCPCHSSRFTIDGKCIKGPSKYDITYKNN